MKIFPIKKVLEIKNLVVEYYRPKKNLFTRNPINLDLYKGDLLCVIGSSGCGKSTLMDACLNNVFNFRGSIRFDPTTHTVQFNDNLFLKELNFEENLRIYLRLNNIRPSEEYFRRIKDYMEKFENFSYDQPIEACSFGTRRRIDLYLRLFEPNTSLFFLDEPTQGLDSYSVNRIVNLIREFHTSKTTFFIVTHEEMFMEIANKILVLDEEDYTLITAQEEFGLIKLKRSDWSRILQNLNALDTPISYKLVINNPKIATILLKTYDYYSHNVIKKQIETLELRYYFESWKDKTRPLKNVAEVYFRI